MPTYEYKCPNGHTHDLFFKTFSEAEEYADASPCYHCDAPAERIVSRPFPAHLYGRPEGYHKSSATKRHSTKTVSAKDGNY